MSHGVRHVKPGHRQGPGELFPQIMIKRPLPSEKQLQTQIIITEAYLSEPEITSVCGFSYPLSRDSGSATTR